MPSDAAERPAELPEWEWLERSVQQLLEDHAAWQRRAEAAERRIRELEVALREFADGRLNPMQLAEQARDLEQTNKMLENRLSQARETVQRMLARLRFAEEEN